MKRKILGFFKSLLGKEKVVKEEKALTQPADIIKYKLEELMKEQKPFLKPGYNIKDLANDMQMPSYQVSYFLNRSLQVNFNDYLNYFRIKYCEDLIKKNTETKLSLQGLALKCGFHNRNTFTTAFKKVTGKTPSEYAKRFIKS
jgi:AraC-like DNA-binding protein